MVYTASHGMKDAAGWMGLTFRLQIRPLLFSKAQALISPLPYPMIALVGFWCPSKYPFHLVSLIHLSPDIT